MNNINRIKMEFLTSLLKGDRLRCMAIAEDYFKGNNNVIDFYEDIIKQSLYEVGNLWEMNRITAAAEHLASTVTESIMNNIYYKLISDNRHQNSIIGLR